MAETIPSYLPTLNPCSTDNQRQVSTKSSTTVGGPRGLEEMCCLSKTAAKTQELTQ